MKLIFNDPSFSFELLRAIGYTIYDGDNIGECVLTAQRTKEGDFESWWTEWHATAVRIEAIAERCEARAHAESARCAYLRASNYYRVAEFFLHANPSDPRILETWGNSVSCFAKAAKLAGPTWRRVEIPYEGTTLPGYLYTVGDSAKPRPTLIYLGGFDSIMEELYFAGGAAALRHGYNCLTFEGPGQGRLIREQHLPYRPDWEKIVTPVVDFACNLPEVDKDNLALMGMSLGGYFAPRATAYEPRIKALIAYDGIYDYYQTTSLMLSKETMALVDGPGDKLDAAIQKDMATDAGLRWWITNGIWTFGVHTPHEFLGALQAYTLEGCVQNIHCPTLVLSADKDQFLKGQPQQLFDRLSCEKKYVRFTSEEAAEEHCQEGAMALFHQTIFDWLDETFAL